MGTILLRFPLVTSSSTHPNTQMSRMIIKVIKAKATVPIIATPVNGLLFPL